MVTTISCTWKLFSHLSVATVQTSTTAQVIRGLAGLPMLKNDPWRAMSLLKGRRRKTSTLAMIFWMGQRLDSVVFYRVSNISRYIFVADAFSFFI